MSAIAGSDAGSGESGSGSGGGANGGDEGGARAEAAMASPMRTATLCGRPAEWLGRLSGSAHDTERAHVRLAWALAAADWRADVARLSQVRALLARYCATRMDSRRLAVERAHDATEQARIERILKADEWGADLAALHQYELWVQHELRQPDLQLGCTLAGCALTAFREQELDGCAVDAELGHALTALGIEHTTRHATPTGFVIDFALPAQKLGILVDGPEHFVGSSHTLTGARALKHRQLRALGWGLVSVPYFEWQPLRALPEPRSAYLLDILSTVEPP